MSEMQVGDQSSKPQDLEKTENLINATIESEAKKQMGSLSGLEKMTKGNEGGDFSGMTGGSLGGGQSSFMSGGTSNEQGSTPTSLFAGDVKKSRKKGSVSLSEFRSPTNSFTGAKRDKAEIMSRKRVAESAFAGKLKKGCKYSTARSAELVEECEMLKKRWEWLPKGLVANKNMLPSFGFGHLLEAWNSVQAEKEKPAMAAVISGTANDMDKFSNLFKSGLDEGVKEQVYANASAQFKQKLNPLMSQ